MSEPDKIRGYIGPNFPPEESKESEVDPEKFRKVMKVGESDEAPKKKKREKAEEPEDEEEEVEEAPPPPNAQTSFSEFMEDSKEVDNLFDIEEHKSPSLPKEEATKTTSPYYLPTEMNPPEEEEEETFFSTTSEEEPPPISAYPEQRPSTDQVPPSNEQPQQTTPSQQAPQAEQKQEKTQKEEEKDTSLFAQSLSKGKLPQKKEDLKKHKVPPNKETQTTSKEEEVSYMETSVQTPKISKEQKKEPAIQEEAKEELEAAFPPPKEPIKEEHKEKEISKAAAELGPVPPKKETHEKKGPKEVKEEIAVPLSPTPSESISAAEAPELQSSPIMSLSPELYALMEKMVGIVTIAQTNQVTTTTVTLQMKNSVFDGATIKVEQYKTAQNVFHIKLEGSPQAVEKFNANYNDLAAALSQSKYNVEIQLERPVIGSKYHRQIKRKAPTTKGKSGREKKQ